MLILSFFWPNFDIDRNTFDVYSKDAPIIRVYNIFGEMKRNYLIKSDINNNKIGTYNIKCEVKLLFVKIKKNFKIYIVDKEKPILTLKGNNPAFICPNDDYAEEGYEAIDNYDGDISNNVLTENKGNSIWYTVMDTSNNEAKLERKIVYDDTEKPSITLKGNKTITVYLGNSYYEPGYTAYDNCDGDITDKVISTGSVDTNKIGNYTINYEVSDNKGNKANIERTVIVKLKPSYYGNGNIYLTFDDGPSYLTREILDILDEENVKATFFVTSANEDTKRAYNSGHTIGLHTYSHDYAYVYANSNNYFNDLNKISDKVYNVIGIRSKFIRFPGGSSNTVSKKYYPGIMTYLTSEVSLRGYKYYDWNIDSEDATRRVDENKVYENVVSHLKPNRENIILMHDFSANEPTKNALRRIIQYGKENGYIFAPITENTNEIHHHINN